MRRRTLGQGPADGRTLLFVGADERAASWASAFAEIALRPFGADDATLRSVFAGARRCAEVLRTVGHPASDLCHAGTIAAIGA